jgi:hypothetical protein
MHEDVIRGLNTHDGRGFNLCVNRDKVIRSYIARKLPYV